MTFWKGESMLQGKVKQAVWQVPLLVITDGESCDLSHELALFFKEMGFENVRVLVNGWTVWQQAGLPTETGG